MLNSSANYYGPGAYILILHVKQNHRIPIGKLGNIEFQTGYYVYTGSAFGPGGLPARLKHHFKLASRPHWHIDYLRQACEIEQVWISEVPSQREHDWAAMFHDLPVWAVPVNKFGSSDCRCRSHLFYLQNKPDFSVFQKIFQKQFPDDKPIQKLNLSKMKI